MNRREEYVMEK